MDSGRGSDAAEAGPGSLSAAGAKSKGKAVRSATPRTSVIDQLLQLGVELEAPLSEVLQLLRPAIAASAAAGSGALSGDPVAAGFVGGRSAGGGVVSAAELRRQLGLLGRSLGVAASEARRMAVAAPALLRMSEDEIATRVARLTLVLQLQPATTADAATLGGSSNSSVGAAVSGGLAPVLCMQPELLLMDNGALDVALQQLAQLLNVTASRAAALAAAHPILLLQAWRAEGEGLPARLSALQGMLNLPLAVITELAVREPRLLHMPLEKLQAGADKLSAGFTHFGSADAMVGL